MKAAIYCRKSKETKKGDSIENQIHLCEEYASFYLKDKNIDEFFYYKDDGFTGSNVNRPDFQRLLEDIKHKKFDILICYRLDRISRDVANFSSTLNLLTANNIDFVSIKEQFDTTTPIGRAMIYFASVFAQLERETIAERVKDNMLELSKTGRWLGGVSPLGYEPYSIKYTGEDLKEHSLSKLRAVPEELKLVKLIFQKYIELASLSKVEAYLLENNFTNRRGNNFDKTKIKLIIENPVYAKSTKALFDYLANLDIAVYGTPDGIHGLLRYNKQKGVYSPNGKITRVDRDKSEWIATVSSHKGIIEANDWIKAQKIMESNKNKFVVSARTHNALLTGLITCKECGSKMQIAHGHTSVVTGQKTYYYVCRLKKESKGTRCASKNIKTTDIDPYVINFIKEIGNNTNNIVSSIENIKNQFKIQSSPICKEDKLQKLLEEKQKQIDRLVTKLSLNDDLDDIILPKIKLLKKEISKIKFDLSTNNLLSENIEEENVGDQFFKTLLNKYSIIESLDIDEQKRLIRGVIKEVIWDSKNSNVKIIPINDINLVKPKKI